MPRPRRPRLPPGLVAGPLAAVTAVFLSPGAAPGLAFATQFHRSLANESEAGSFARCGRGHRDDCVVDGDTFRYHGETIRIADINTPELHDPGCSREAELAEAASERLTHLLNAGPFTLAAADRQRDRYGRLLRVVTRRGASLGETLVAEGLAEEWKGYRGSWC